MFSTIFTSIGDAATGIVTVLGSILQSITSWFWVVDPTTNVGELTFIGNLSVIALVGGLVFFGIRWVRSLISMKRAM